MPSKGRKKTKKNKGQRNPKRVLLRSLQLELKHRQRDIVDQIVRARVQPAIDNAPWFDEKVDKCEHNLVITKKCKYRSGVCISTVVKLRSQPIRLIDAQEADFAADFLEQESSEDSYYSDEEGVYLQEGQVAASSSKAAASSWVAESAQEDYDYYEAYDDYESQVQQEDRSSRKLKEEAQSEYTYTYEKEDKSEDEYTYEYEYPSSESAESEGSESEDRAYKRFNSLPSPAYRVSLSPDSDSSVAVSRARKKVKKRTEIA